jgi:hypothetical protein
MALAESIKAGLENPDCAFFVGFLSGQSSAIKTVIIVAGIGLAYKLVDKLAFEPFVAWLKRKIW